MKKKLLVFTALIACTAIIYSSCTKIDALIRAQAISFTATDLSFDVPVITNTATNSSIGTGTFTYNLDSLIRAQTVNQFGLANIDTVTLTSCTLTIQNPDADNNFADFESANGSFSTSANATNTTMGSIDNNPDTYATTLTVPVNTGVNLKSYVASSGPTTFSYSVDGQGLAEQQPKR